MQSNKQLNQRAIEILCDEIMKAVEVRTKRIIAETLKSNGRANGATVSKSTASNSLYPVGSYCILQNDISPSDHWTGTWTKIDGDIYIAGSANDGESQLTTLGAAIWKRVK